MTNFCSALAAASVCMMSMNTAQAALSDFAGAWCGTGTFQGAPSEIAINIAPMLEGKAWSLDVAVSVTPPKGEPFRFLGRAQYALRDGMPVSGNWIDSQGTIYSVTPRLENNTLSVEWGDTAPVHGRSEYVLSPGTTLEVKDFAPAKQLPQKMFATAKLKRC